jgi:hypothetical protein
LLWVQNAEQYQKTEKHFDRFYYIHAYKIPNNSYKLITIQHGFAPGFVNYKKGCTRLTAASIKVYELLAHGRWFSPGTPASSTIDMFTYFNVYYWMSHLSASAPDIYL